MDKIIGNIFNVVIIGFVIMGAARFLKDLFDDLFLDK